MGVEGLIYFLFSVAGERRGNAAGRSRFQKVTTAVYLLLVRKSKAAMIVIYLILSSRDAS